MGKTSKKKGGKGNRKCASQGEGRVVVLEKGKRKKKVIISFFSPKADARACG